MTNTCQPALLGFGNTDAINVLLGHLGLTPDLGAVLVEHLPVVLRRQFSDLDIELIEFVKSGNCMVDGVKTPVPHIAHIQTLSIPFNVNAVVTAMKEKYRLNLDITFNASLAGGRYEIMSDVKVQSQVFLGAAISSC